MKEKTKKERSEEQRKIASVIDHLDLSLAALDLESSDTGPAEKFKRHDGYTFSLTGKDGERIFFKASIGDPSKEK